jgi:hypothetical protein
VSTGYEGPLEEFRALRQEIDSRSRNQHQILSLQLTTAGGIFGLVISKPHLFALLTVVPVTSYLLCGRFATQGHAVEAAARYIMDELDQRVPGGLRWEAWQRADKRKDYRWAWFVPLLLTFSGASALAIGSSMLYYFAFEGKGDCVHVWTVAVWMAGLLLLVGTVLLLRALRKKLPDRAGSSPGGPCKCVGRPGPRGAGRRW